MRVIHILADGSTTEDITGHVIRIEDNKKIYDLVERLDRKTEEKNK